MENHKTTIKKVWNNDSKPKSKIDLILEKPNESITEKELEFLHKSLFDVKSPSLKERINDKVSQLFQHKYPNSREDASGKTISDEAKLSNRETLTEKQKVESLAEFLKDHSDKVGEEQAFKDLQRGLNILNGYAKESPIEEFRPVKEDGDFGVITNASLKNISEIYSLGVIKKYITIGAFNNAMKNSKFDKKINLAEVIQSIEEKLDYKKGEINGRR